MEPLLGGKLVTGLPKEAAALFAKTNPALSPASWGLRWLWNQEEVSCVLSGMSTISQMEENIRSAEDFSPLSEDEQAAYKEVARIFDASYKIHCTGCNYCMPCPKGINIPDSFAAYNISFAQGFVIGMKQYITSIAAIAKKTCSPRLCVDCGKCESHCPQHLPIRKSLKQVARRMEPLPIRFVLFIARLFFR
jgi:predicted aldo/keto reductase-like oxidoreductase